MVSWPAPIVPPVATGAVGPGIVVVPVWPVEVGVVAGAVPAVAHELVMGGGHQLGVVLVVSVWAVDVVVVVVLPPMPVDPPVAVPVGPHEAGGTQELGAVVVVVVPD